MSYQGHGRYTAGVEIIGHEVGVLDGDTEAKCPHITHVSDITIQTAENMIGAFLGNGMADNIQVAQFALVIAAPDPVQIVQIYHVGYAKVLEGAKQLPVNGFRQADFSSNAAAKIIQDGFAIHAIRRGCQPQQHFGHKVFQCFPVAVGNGVVSFVDDDIDVIIRGQFGVQCLRIESLYGNKQMI